MNDDLDELDHALFALPLATPPAGLHESILRATVYAQATPQVPFSALETVGIGVALAVAAWLLIATLTDHVFVSVVGADAYALLRAAGDPTTLAWLATGGAIAVLLTLSNLVPLRQNMRQGRS